MTAASQQPADGPPSLWEDCLEIFYSPAAVFERRREFPVFAGALILFVVVTMAVHLGTKSALSGVADAEFHRNTAAVMKAHPEITAEQMEKMRSFGESFGWVGVLGWALIAPLFCGLVLWAAGTLVESKASLGQVMMVSTFSFIPRILGMLAAGLMALLLPAEKITSIYSVALSPARWLDVTTTSPMVLALVGRVELFTLWSTVLFAIGLAVVGKIPRLQALVAAAIVWVVGALPAVWGASRMQ